MLSASIRGCRLEECACVCVTSCGSKIDACTLGMCLFKSNMSEFEKLPAHGLAIVLIAMPAYLPTGLPGARVEDTPSVRLQDPLCRPVDGVFGQKRQPTSPWPEKPTMNSIVDRDQREDEEMFVPLGEAILFIWGGSSHRERLTTTCGGHDPGERMMQTLWRVH
ncbi:hypothetical protein B0T17DRAFT_602462 [Bombardia bombarda]|uniref:Uncharacterized protein n=1 Tax=Bombardia bombarda TaxID=252184 RepID=A0AA39U7N0_9PEZI|nr:hypothetical protein B0T17DRAFT_602462 [Bombardia bombarda]